MRFLILFAFLISNCVAAEIKDIKNLVINKELKKYDGLTFLDDQSNEIQLDQFEGNLVLLNFWATWCAPCKEEMPSLDQLQSRKNLNNLKTILKKLIKSNKKFNRLRAIEKWDGNAGLRLCKDLRKRGYLN